MLLLALGLVGVCWSCFAIPIYWSSGAVRETSAKLLANERFGSRALASLSSGGGDVLVGSFIPPENARAVAIVKLGIVDQATRSGRPADIDRQQAEADSHVSEALQLIPGDGYLWLARYSLEVARNGFDAGAVGDLERSYQLAPREAWLALRRNKLALSVFADLHEEVERAVIFEFGAMVDCNFIDEAFESLVGPGWQYREALLSPLERTNAASREAFARRLARDGVQVEIPGIQRDGKLWWQP